MAASAEPPRPLLHPSWRDRLERRRPPAGPPRRAAQCARPRAGAPLRRNPARPVRARLPRSPLPRLCSSRRRAPARPWNWRARRSGLARKATGVEANGSGNLVRRVGGLHHRAIASRDPQRIAAREHDKWHLSATGRRELRAGVGAHARLVRELARDTVAVAHGGTARGLIAHLGIAKPAAAPLLDIAQGVVYLFQADQIMRYA